MSYEYKIGDRVRSAKKSWLGDSHGYKEGFVSGFDHARGLLYVTWKNADKNYPKYSLTAEMIKELELIVTIEGFEI